MRRRSRARRALTNLRHGRVQRSLSALTAASALPLAFEVYIEHYKGSFGNKWEWVPIFLTPPVVAAGIGGVYSERIARTALPLSAGLFGACSTVPSTPHAPNRPALSGSAVLAIRSE